LQWSHLFKGEFERVITLKEEMLKKSDQGITPRRAVSPFLYATWAYAWLGRWAQSVKNGTKALDLVQKYSDESLFSMADYFLSHTYAHKGNLNRAIGLAEQAVQKATTPVDNACSLGILAWARCRAGEWEQAIQPLAEVVQALRDGNHVSLALYFMPMLAEGYFLSREYSAASQLAQQTVELAQRVGARYPFGWACRLLGEITLETSSNEAATHFEKDICIATKIKAENELGLAYSGMGRYHIQQRNMEEARKYLTDALEIFERLGTLIEPDKVRKELAELPISA
jgi:tetratricopeptide (TPR) repeat protein